MLVSSNYRITTVGDWSNPRNSVPSDEFKLPLDWTRQAYSIFHSDITADSWKSVVSAGLHRHSGDLSEKLNTSPNLRIGPR